MPLSGTPAPNKRKKGTQRIVTDLTHITQDENATNTGTSEFDLGRKIGIPKDIMLEELSLLKNKGSLMFKMRQKRVERFIYENNPDVFIPDSMDYHQKLVPGMGGKMDVGGHLVSGHMVGYAGSGMGGRGPMPPPKPGSLHHGVEYGVAGGHATGHGSITGGKGQGQHHGAGTQEGGGLHGVGAGGDAGGAGGAGGSPAKKIEYVKTYLSPWERAMKGNADLIATLKPHMPGPEPYHELRKYKSFNRCAMPYGGFKKAVQLMTFQLPEVTSEDLGPTLLNPHDNRPSFNRTPIGWIGSGETSHIHLAMETVPFDGETDEL